ncbi:MAG: S-layer homology domain-containing protein [Phormidesmis sp. CAN_BIN44]|nr:S-layer homology domain-containing protein [Phormidesmis sp. CAN_BIN44]
MKNSKKGLVSATQGDPNDFNSFHTVNTRGAIVSTDSPNLEAYKTVFTTKDVTDIAETDWAFQAFQSLLEYHGVVQVYADNTFRGDRAATRYETAHLINLGLTHCTKWTYCESTYLGRFNLLQIPLLGLKWGREE